jgi:hypothetical protein
MSDKYNDQQKFDSTMHLFLKRTILHDIPLCYAVGQIGDLIKLIKRGQEAIEVLEDIQNLCRVNSVPKDSKVRSLMFNPLDKNATTRGGTPALGTKTPARRSKGKVLKPVDGPKPTPKKTVAYRVHMMLKKNKGNRLTLHRIASRLGLEASSVNYGMRNLLKEQKVNRFKAKASEKTYNTTKWVYEVAA